MKDLAFELSVPSDPAFRGLAAPAAGKYGESLGLAEDEARALESSLQEAVDLSAGAGHGEVTIVVERSGDRLDMTVTAGGRRSTLSRQLATASK